MWELIPTDQFQSDLKWYSKKRPLELAAVLNNLERYCSLLNTSINAACVQAGFLHSEPRGVKAIDQRGSAGSLQETRLYTFANDDDKTLHLITIGNKNTQRDDVKRAADFVKSLKTD